jgi:hypothetical protein
MGSICLTVNPQVDRFLNFDIRSSFSPHSVAAAATTTTTTTTTELMYSKGRS